MTRGDNVLFIVGIVGTAMSGAVLVLTVPAMTVGDGVPSWLPICSAVALAVFAIIARRWRPEAPAHRPPR